MVAISRVIAAVSNRCNMFFFFFFFKLWFNLGPIVALSNHHNMFLFCDCPILPANPLGYVHIFNPRLRFRDPANLESLLYLSFLGKQFLQVGEEPIIKDVC